MKRQVRLAIVLASLALAAGLQDWRVEARGQAPTTPPAPAGRAGGGRANVPPPDPTKPVKLEVVEGTKARYKVREQLAGISFPSDAVGTTESVTGTIVLNPDGSIDSSKSKLTVDLRTLKSDQQMRDGYIQSRTLETEKFPTIEFVPRRAVGLPVPLPAGMQAQAGFQLIGDLTLHGVTSEATWNVVAGLTAQQVSGILKATASGRGKWSPQLGYGVIDVAAAVAAARGQAVKERVQAGSWLSLRRVGERASRNTRQKRGLRGVRLAVHLRSSAPTVTPDYRLITLQVRLGKSWHRLARTTTRLGGGIRWRVGLEPGRYVVRAIYRGRWDMHGAIRLKPITVR